MKNFIKITGYILIFLSATTNSHAAGDNLLSVDKTILVQLVIVIVALYALNVLIFKPLLGLLDRREKLTRGTLGEAKNLTGKAEKLIEDYNRQIDDARTMANKQRTEIRKEAQQAAAKMISEARQESQILLANYKKDLDAQAKSVKEKIKPEIENLAGNIASKILGTEV